MSEKYKRFCIKCGTTLKKEDLIERLCFNCYILKNPPVILKEQPIIYLCRECLAIKTKNEWIKTSPLDFYEDCNQLLTEDVHTYFEIAPNINVRFELIEFPDFEDLFHFNTIPFNLIISGKYLNTFEINETQQYLAKIKLGICGNCTEYKANVTKAKIRIIAKKRKITDLEIEKIIKIFKDIADKYEDPNLYILTPVIKNDEIIFRTSSIGFAKEIEIKFKNIFSAVIRESHKYKSRGPEKSRQKRGNLHVLIKLLPFFVGDVIKYNNEFLYVINIQNYRISCFNFESKEMEKFSPKQLTNADRYLANSELEKFLISAVCNDVIQVMDLKSCQIFEINKEAPFTDLEEGTEIGGFKEIENIHLIPFDIQREDDEIE